MYTRSIEMYYESVVFRTAGCSCLCPILFEVLLVGGVLKAGDGEGGKYGGTSAFFQLSKRGWNVTGLCCITTSTSDSRATAGVFSNSFSTHPQSTPLLRTLWWLPTGVRTAVLVPCRRQYPFTCRPCLPL